MTTPNALEKLLQRAEQVLARLEQCLPPAPPPPDWQNGLAFRWRKRNGQCFLQTLTQPRLIPLQHLRDIVEQKARIVANTTQFLAGRPANNVLLTGARGTGKSSLIRALLHAYASQGLRLIEVDKDNLVDLPDILNLLEGREAHFIVFCDDLSFEAEESGYKALKTVLDGSMAALPGNVLIYATSNRRHLMPEYHDENLLARHIEGEIHPGEAVEEKIALSERFGLCLSFYPFSQQEYLAIVRHWLALFDVPAAHDDEACQQALQWALERGSRSGRVAWQFARDFAGRKQ